MQMSKVTVINGILNMCSSFIQIKNQHLFLPAKEKKGNLWKIAKKPSLTFLSFAADYNFIY